MIHAIEISDNLFNRLGRHAKPSDTRASVIERLLDYYEKRATHLPESSTGLARVATTTKFDYTKYLFNGRKHGKRHLVLAVIKEYANTHPNLSFGELSEVFPKSLQGTGIFDRVEVAEEIHARTGHKRYFIAPKDVIELSDCSIAVSTQWGKSNIGNFIRTAEEIGYKIEPVKDD